MSHSRPQVETWEALALVVILTIGLTPLAAVLGLGFLVPIFPIVGFVILLPLIAVFGERLPYIASENDDEVAPLATEAGSEDDIAADDPVAKLRDRYARGEIGEDEFERRLERLLETEDFEGTVDVSRDRSTELE